MFDDGESEKRNKAETFRTELCSQTEFGERVHRPRVSCSSCPLVPCVCSTPPHGTFNLNHNLTMGSSGNQLRTLEKTTTPTHVFVFVKSSLTQDEYMKRVLLKVTEHDVMYAE
ncbi:unnamed protein product [Pleuronectes platessa]|uniref:Uncharacterized protein n=1 Tax=Pleuronectes platessa TaxID=8262 RepID=A0A9N7VE10_PLEPL|nr:unnamed protein product [Pleuronectes platessa]